MKRLAFYTFKPIRYMTCNDLDELCSPLVHDVCKKVKCCSVTGRELETRKRCKRYIVTIAPARASKRKCKCQAVKK